jgi:hypothetical protein
MNYAVVILTFVFIVSLSYWYMAGRKYYTGPRTRAHVVNGVVVEDELAKMQDNEAAQPGFLPKSTTNSD